jgi:hypothetical protein
VKTRKDCLLQRIVGDGLVGSRRSLIPLVIGRHSKDTLSPSAVSLSLRFLKDQIEVSTVAAIYTTVSQKPMRILCTLLFFTLKYSTVCIKRGIIWPTPTQDDVGSLLLL